MPSYTNPSHNSLTFTTPPSGPNTIYLQHSPGGVFSNNSTGGQSVTIVGSWPELKADPIVLRVYTFKQLKVLQRNWREFVLQDSAGKKFTWLAYIQSVDQLDPLDPTAFTKFLKTHHITAKSYYAAEFLAEI